MSMIGIFIGHAIGQIIGVYLALFLTCRSAPSSHYFRKYKEVDGQLIDVTRYGEAND